MIIRPNSHRQTPTVQRHTAKTRAADAQRQPPLRPRCVGALWAVISTHKSKSARKTEKEMFSDLKNVPRFLKNYLINNAVLSRGQHLVYAPLDSKLDGWAMVGKKSHKGETKIQKRGPTFKKLKEGPHEVNPDSLEPTSRANGGYSKTPPVRCRVQNGNSDCVPRGAVVHAVHIPHRMTWVLGHGQGDSAVEQL